MPNTESSANISGPGRSLVEDLPIAVASVSAGGQLLSYTDNGTLGNLGPANVAVGNGDWQPLKFLFAGRNFNGVNQIYAVNDKGRLLAYTDNGKAGNISAPTMRSDLRTSGRMTRLLESLSALHQRARLTAKRGRSIRR